MVPYRVNEVVTTTESHQLPFLEDPIEVKLQADLSKIKYEDIALMGKVMMIQVISDFNKALYINTKFNFYQSADVQLAIRLLRDFNSIMDRYYRSEVSWVLLTLEKLQEAKDMDVLKKEKNEQRKNIIYEKIEEQRMLARTYGRLLVIFCEEFKSLIKQLNGNLSNMLKVTKDKEETVSKQQDIIADTRFGLDEIIADINQLTVDRIDEYERILNGSIEELKRGFRSLNFLIEDFENVRQKYTKKTSNAKPA